MMMPERYVFKEIETKWYQRWEESGAFGNIHKDAEPYVIVIPPPNITGALHMGHALNNTIQDILIRWKRMSGFDALWVPGTDHAGIATQNVVEKEIAKEGLSRETLGREKFEERLWQWRHKYGDTIILQLKRLGASCDWNRLCFTLDENFSLAVRTVFVKLYQKGLIYRGHRIINWCPRCATALSDEETTYLDEETSLYYIAYPGLNGASLAIATTRPETMLGDTAVAVHPNDTRYSAFIGGVLRLPLTEREIPVIADEMVDPEFGTGAVKVTPGHDPNDFILGKKHHLPSRVIMDTRGIMTQETESFAGMDRFACREAVVNALKKEGFLLKVEPYETRIGHCYRCNTVIEPYLSEQWFVKMKDLAQPAIDAVEQGNLSFYPDRWTKVYLNWLENIQDWCISRQLWWGHRIPVWYCKKEDCPPIVSVSPPKKCPVCDNSDLTQDPDVLDTWFSSWLWPFGVFGWPNPTDDLAKYYPTSTLATAQEIIFFWVARMVMAGFEFKGTCPFKDVYINGTVRDSTGRKMSKSLGNSVDPLEIIEKTGADSLRFSLISLTGMGQDLFLPEDFHLKGRNFLNKIWNSFRYILLKSGKNHTEKVIIKKISSDSQDFEIPEQWILSRLEESIINVTKALEQFRFNEAADTLYGFFWHDFCDWYLEFSKFHKEDSDYFIHTVKPVLFHTLFQSLKLLHPFIPFITEELWNRGKEYVELEDSLLITSTWPTPNTKGLTFPESCREMQNIQDLIVEIRDLKSTFKIPLMKDLSGSWNNIPILRNKTAKKLVEFMAKVSLSESSSEPEKREDTLLKNWEGGWFTLHFEGLVDFSKEAKKLRNTIEKNREYLEQLKKKLHNAAFLTNAPAAIVERTRSQQERIIQETEQMEQDLSLLTRE
ncbi:MAG: valine--tRNA ligase [Candidatus Ratteibacteria bacterium]|jgi:valyl-tRNA synthetase